MSEPDTHENDVDESIADDADQEDGAAAEFDRLTSERDEALAKYQRALADFQNFQRRAYANEETARQRAKADLVRDLVPALENLDHVVEQQGGDEAIRAIRQGVRMVRDEILKALDNQGVRRIEPQPGDEFDPNRHQAMMHLDVEGIAPNHIAQVLKAGYAIDQIVIRPATVALARGSD